MGLIGPGGSRVASPDDDEESDDREMPDSADMDRDEEDDFSSEDSSGRTPVWIVIGVILCLAVVVFLWLR
jgi:hypothetical protein